MKGVFVLLDGLGDLPHKLLGDKTPLEAANTPNLDFLAKKGELGYMYPIRPAFIPESDESIVSIFGNELISSTRGQLEARGTDIKLTRGDLALRANFATIDSMEKGNILDRRAGRTLTTKEAEILAKSINKIKLPCDFLFKSTVQHRGVLVFRGGFSDDISDNDSLYRNGYLQSNSHISYVKPLDDSENAFYTSNILNEFLEKVYHVLNEHPINEERRRKGLLPANYLLIRGGGIEKPKLRYYKNWLAVANMPLEIGFSKTCGMTVFSFEYPKLKKLDVYSNLYEGLKKMCKFSIKVLKRNHKKFDYAYIHIKETDLPGHDNKPLEKKFMIEHLDRTLFNFLRKFALSKKIKIVVTGDHSTPCRLKSHSPDPVPVLYYPADGRVPKEKRFNENEARKGSLGRIIGKDLFSKVGFVR
jgi:2,3-bisphosphoglycerate-independent phosphoglycerate mutase